MAVVIAFLFVVLERIIFERRIALYLSNREKKIVNILLEQPSGVGIEYLAEQLTVSTRTMYRIISSLEGTLAQSQIKLIRGSNGYQLNGQGVLLEQLRHQLQETGSELTVQQRQSKLIITLLKETEAVKMDALAADLKVSVGTVQSDLDSIEELFQEYTIQIKRQKAKGIQAIAAESNRRLIISGLVTSEINEYDFFRLFDRNHQLKLEHWEKAKNPFLYELNSRDLEYAFQALSQLHSIKMEEVTDTQFQRLLTLLSISITRMSEGFFLKEVQQNQYQTFTNNEKSRRIAESLLKKAADVYQLPELPQEEIDFLALQIQGLNVPLQNEFHEDFNVNLGYKVRELIRLVSKDLGWDFYLDETLFQDLLQHISAALNRAQAPMPESGNPLLDKIFVEYKELSYSVEKSLTKLFPGIKFLDNEVAYIVIHFASAYERNPRTDSLSVLVICSSGVGTAKILESRLRKNVSEITDVEISRISQLNAVNYEEYDLILSTVFLQGFEIDYKVVTPLLMDDEVKSIKLYAMQKLEEKKDKKAAQEQLYSQHHEEENAFKAYFEKLSQINTLLEQFNVYSISDKKGLRAILEEITLQLTGSVVANSYQVQEKLEKRMALAPIGLPETHMALFHTVDENILSPYFAIYELEYPIEIPAIDKNLIQMKRILLMLGPEPLSAATQEILGMISGAIVESSANMELFNSGSAKQISQFLNQLYLEKIKQ